MYGAQDLFIVKKLWVKEGTNDKEIIVLDSKAEYNVNGKHVVLVGDMFDKKFTIGDSYRYEELVKLLHEDKILKWIA